MAFAGAEKVDDPGFEEDPGLGLPGTGVDIVADFPPQPQTVKTSIDEKKIDEKKDAIVFEATIKTPGRGTASIPEQQL